MSHEVIHSHTLGVNDPCDKGSHGACRNLPPSSGPSPCARSDSAHRGTRPATGHSSYSHSFVGDQLAAADAEHRRREEQLAALVADGFFVARTPERP